MFLRIIFWPAKPVSLKECFRQNAISPSAKRFPAPKKGRVGVTDLLVVSDKDPIPLGYDALNQTFDDNTKSFTNKQLLWQSKEQVPAGFKRLPEINGLSICYKLTPLPKKRAPSLAAQGSLSQPPTENPPSTEQQQQAQSTPSVQRSVIDDVKIKVNETPSTVQECIEKFTLPGTELLTVDAINAKFNLTGLSYS
eukprot:Em0016g75a